ncbi:MAG: hypothetical protein V4625_13395 [Pseudomonadota bacterium]
MNHPAPFAALFLCAVVAGCSSLPDQSASTTVTISGDAYLITQLTASTWTATTTGAPRVINGTGQKASLLAAIEQASRCKVTDSDFSRQGMQLDAQVDCGSRLKN